jgi:hypothetical protein
MDMSKHLSKRALHCYFHWVFSLPSVPSIYTRKDAVSDHVHAAMCSWQQREGEVFSCSLPPAEKALLSCFLQLFELFQLRVYKLFTIGALESLNPGAW